MYSVQRAVAASCACFRMLVIDPAVPAGAKRIYPHTTLVMLMLVPCMVSLLLLVVPESLVMVLLIDAAHCRVFAR